MNDAFSIEEITAYIERRCLYVSPLFVMDYWRKKNWLSKKGFQVQTIEAAVNVANSIYLTIKRRYNNQPTANLKAIRKMELRKRKLESSKFTSYNNQLQDERWLSFR